MYGVSLPAPGVAFNNKIQEIQDNILITSPKPIFPTIKTTNKPYSLKYNINAHLENFADTFRRPKATLWNTTNYAIPDHLLLKEKSTAEIKTFKISVSPIDNNLGEIERASMGRLVANNVLKEDAVSISFIPAYHSHIYRCPICRYPIDKLQIRQFLTIHIKTAHSSHKNRFFIKIKATRKKPIKFPILPKKIFLK